MEGPGVWQTLGGKKEKKEEGRKKDWSLANSEKKKVYTYSYTHMVVHTSMYDGEEA